MTANGKVPYRESYMRVRKGEEGCGTCFFGSRFQRASLQDYSYDVCPYEKCIARPQFVKELVNP